MVIRRNCREGRRSLGPDGHHRGLHQFDDSRDDSHLGDLVLVHHLRGMVRRVLGGVGDPGARRIIGDDSQRLILEFRVGFIFQELREPADDVRLLYPREQPDDHVAVLEPLLWRRVVLCNRHHLGEIFRGALCLWKVVGVDGPRDLPDSVEGALDILKVLGLVLRALRLSSPLNLVLHTRFLILVLQRPEPQPQRVEVVRLFETDEEGRDLLVQLCPGESWRLHLGSATLPRSARGRYLGRTKIWLHPLGESLSEFLPLDLSVLLPIHIPVDLLDEHV
mmetsp:Transcript_3701/g.8803  ORF Transcript_3701/g.8803 Transcript_3701/m.8803 type:complete len:278 (-) Transcript_3701:312-1145(-)